MNTETKAKTNPFGTAAKKEPATARKSEMRVVKDESLGDQVERFAVLTGNIADMEAEQKMLAGVIKENAKKQWIDAYSSLQSNPGNFKIQGKGQKAVTVIIMDKYKSIDEDAATQLKKLYGNAIVTSKTEYAFNATILEKHFDKISEAMGNLDIPEEDLSGLLIKTEQYSIAKGTVDRLLVNGPEKAAEIFLAISPIIALKP